MKMRAYALVATIALLGSSAANPAAAQPIAPPRAPNNAFGNFFSPGYAVPNAGYGYGGYGGYNYGLGYGGIGGFGGLGGMGMMGMGGFGGMGMMGMGGMGGLGAFGPFGGYGGYGPNNAMGLGSQRYYGPFAPYILNMQPVLFNSRGHWYSMYYSHWYPNGVANGMGVISNGGRSGANSGLMLLSGAQGPGMLGGAPPAAGGPQAPAAAVPGVLGNPPGQNK